MRRCGNSAILIVVLATSAVVKPSAVQAQSYTGEGAALGGVAGAVTGGIIGHQNGETPEGALIGGAVGAIAGGLLGNARDKQVARERSYQQQIWQQQQQLNYQRQTAVAPADVVQMCRSGVSEGVIVNHILTNGVQRRLETHDIISLHQQGVSEGVINAMQRAPLSNGAALPTAPPQPQTVIVREQYPVAPVYVHPHPYYYYRAPRPVHAGFHYHHRF